MPSRRNSRVFFRATLVALSVILTGCAAGALQTTDPAQLPESFDQWEMRAKIAVRTENDGGSATVIWERVGDDNHIDMYGPFGGGRVRIDEQPGEAVLRDNEGAEYRADNATQLLYQRLGWHVPFEQLRYWVRGVPAPGPVNVVETENTGGLILRMEQDGWDVTFSRHRRYGPALMPGRIFLRSLPGTLHLVDEDGEPLEDGLNVKLVVKSWHFGA